MRYTFFGFGPPKPDPNNNGKLGYEFWITTRDAEFGESFMRMCEDLGPPTFTEVRLDEEEYTPLQVARALVMWDHNRDASGKYADVYGEKPEGDFHQEEKVAAIRRGDLPYLWAMIDKPHQQRLVDAALKQYGGR